MVPLNQGILQQLSFLGGFKQAANLSKVKSHLENFVETLYANRDPTITIWNK